LKVQAEYACGNNIIIGQVLSIRAVRREELKMHGDGQTVTDGIQS